MFGPLGSGAIGANNLDIREISSAELNISVSVAYNSIVSFNSTTGNLEIASASSVESAVYAISTGNLELDVAGAVNATIIELSLGELVISASTGTNTETAATSAVELEIQSATSFSFVPAGYTNVDVDVGSDGELVISGTHVFSQGYIRTSQGELQIEAVSELSGTYPRTSLVPLEIAGTSDVVVSTLAEIYTVTSTGILEIAGSTSTALAIAHASQVDLVLVVAEQAGKAEGHAHGGSRTLKEKRAREHAYISHVRLGMRIETTDAGYVPAPEPSVAESKAPRPLGEFEKFLQNFGHRSVDYSFDSSTGTVSFWVRSETETSNPRTDRALAEQIDDEDALLLGISENGLVLDSSYTHQLRESHSRRHSIEQDDLRMLGLGELS